MAELFDFEGVLHSVHFLEHPRNAGGTKLRSLTLLCADFLRHFEPVSLDEAKADRAREQASVMERVQAIQQEMLQAQENPLQIAEVRAEADRAVEEYERMQDARSLRESNDQQRREADLRRIHRRAARRSQEQGNPLVVRKATVSDRLDVMIAEGVTMDGVRELQEEAGRRQAIAEATSKWLERRVRAMSDVLAGLAPYAAEQGQLALATASGAIQRVKTIDAGIASLKLYTGDGVEVFTVREGAQAPTSEPLTIVQGKLAMDEELAVHMPVENDFDCSDRKAFFSRLATHEDLLDQMMPTSRCVVAVQVTRRKHHYSQEMSVFEQLAREQENQRVFLLVRNGQNVHAVYSAEPSHEAAQRLFPTRGDLQRPFQGIDGSAIGLQDVAFSRSAGRFEDLTLHYRRFLILLCGLDHRLGLFGDFAPAEAKAGFMSAQFQQRYMRFLENDDPGLLLGEEREPVADWMARHNAQLRTGSRVVVDDGATLDDAIPLIVRSAGSIQVDKQALGIGSLIANAKEGQHYLSVPTISQRGPRMGTTWLTGPQAYGENRQWFLCIDRVSLPEVRRYIYDRQQRIASIAWLRTLRRVEQALLVQQRDEQALRAHLRQAAMDAAIQQEDEIDAAIDGAIATWRADHRGAPAPSLSERKEVEQLLSLIFPADSLAKSMRPLIEHLCSKLGLQPLLATRTGKNQLVLYSMVPEPEREPYGTGVTWGWVRRHRLRVSGRGASLASSTLAWLHDKQLTSREEPLLDWPGHEHWIHKTPEPIRPSALLAGREAVDRGGELVQELRRWRLDGSGIPEDVLIGWLDTVRKHSRGSKFNEHFYLLVPLALYQQQAHGPIRFCYARCNLIDLVRTHGTAEQLALLMATPGMRSVSMAKFARRAEPLSWTPRVGEAPGNNWLYKHSLLPTTTAAPWMLVSSHKRGGLGKRSRPGTRAERREVNGAPRHEEVSAQLSWNRAIDGLMGRQPLHSRLFYRGVEERVGRIFGLANAEEVALRRKRVRVERFVPHAAATVELAPGLWDANQGRSVADRYLSGRS